MFVCKYARTAAVCALFLGLAGAQPNLTTISDVLFKADGTRFNGLAQFNWVNFESGNGSNIAMQSKTVRIVDGNLFVQLTPTIDAVPPAQYTVKYSSDGTIQFQEAWAVPISATPLKVRDVRTTQPVFPPGSAGAITQIQESDVIGLVQDLDARPVKGPGYTNSRAAIINDTGGVEGAVGGLSDCVRVDGTAGPCGSGGSTVLFVDAEVPSGAVDGANVSFAISNVPVPAASLHLFRNGILQKAGFDYILASSTITFVSLAAPQPGDILLASYRR